MLRMQMNVGNAIKPAAGLLLLVPAFMHACKTDDPGPGVNADDPGDQSEPEETNSSSSEEIDSGLENTETDTAAAALEPGTIEAEINPFNPFSAIVRATFNQDVEMWAEHGEDKAFDHTTPTVKASAGESVEWMVHGLRAGATHQVRVVATHNSEVFTSDHLVLETEPLPESFPESEVTFTLEESSFDTEEVICMQGWIGDYSGTPVYYCVDRWGEPRWWLQHPEGVSLSEVTVLSDGTIAATGWFGSAVVMFSEQGELLDEYSSLGFAGRTRFQYDWIDGHEILEIHDGPWAGALAITALVEDDIVGLGPRMGAGIIVFDPKNGDVLWDWNSHGVLGDGEPIDPKLEYSRTGAQAEEYDQMHGNGLAHGLDADGGQFFLLSLREQDWVIKIDVDTDKVIWRFGYDGDFELVDDIDRKAPEALPNKDWMYQQHAPIILEQSGSRTQFIVFDNGSKRRDENGEADDTSHLYSRIVVFVLDEDTGQAAPTFIYGSEQTGRPNHIYSWGGGNTSMLPSSERLLYVVPEMLFIAELAMPRGDETWRLDLASGEPYRFTYFPSLYDRTGSFEK